MTPERRKEVVALLKSLSHRESPVNNGMLSAYDDGATSGWAIEEAQARSMALREAADELDAVEALRADLAKAKERIAELEAVARRYNECPDGECGTSVLDEMDEPTSFVKTCRACDRALLAVAP